MTDADVNSAPAVDPARVSYAKAASNGFGMGQIEARRYVEELNRDGFETLQARLKDDMNYSWTVAQSRPVPFAEDVRELVLKGRLEQQDSLDLVYRAGFDIAFSAYLVEAVTAATTRRPEQEPDVPATGASIEGARMA
jgi:hypothetical protein